MTKMADAAICPGWLLHDFIGNQQPTTAITAASSCCHNTFEANTPPPNQPTEAVPPAPARKQETGSLHDLTVAVTVVALATDPNWSGL